MALLPDLNLGAINKDDPQAQIDSIIKQVNEWGRIISNEDRTKIRKDDSGTPRLLDGFQQGGFNNGNVGVKLSQEGVDVLTATSDQLIWSTDFRGFKIIDDPTVQISKTAGVTFENFSFPLPDDIDFTPALLAYLFDPVGGIYYPMPWVVPNVTTGAITTIVTPYINSTHVSFFYSTPGDTTADGPVSIKYYLLRDTAN